MQDIAGDNQEMVAEMGVMEMGNVTGRWVVERDNRAIKGSKEHAKGPSMLGTFELMGWGECDATHTEGGDRPASGLAKNTSVEVNDKLNNGLGPKTNGSALPWKVYSRNSWCRNQNRNAKMIGPKPEQENETNTKEIIQLNAESGQDKCSPTILKGSGLKEVIAWEDQSTEWLEVEVSRINPSPKTSKNTRQAVMNWDLDKRMGVNCKFQEGIVVSKPIDMEERDKEEAKRWGRREKSNEDNVL